MTTIITQFPTLIASYLTVYLPVTRGYSTNTVRSYRDVIILLLRFIESSYGSLCEIDI